MAVASTSPITAIQALGQSVWMDFMSRRFVASGELKARIEEDDLRGCTSNPTIFDKAIRQSADYDEDLTPPRHRRQGRRRDLPGLDPVRHPRRPRPVPADL